MEKLKNRQEKTPVFDGVRTYVQQETLPFHVPGHKQGRGLQEFCDYVGENVMAIDLTCFEGTDNICNPLDEIKEAQELAAEAFGADHAFFLVNGTTSGIQAMIMSVCSRGDKIILPRNAHKSAIGGVILSGAEPVYIQPEINESLGIAMGITPEALREALEFNPDVKAVFVINPTYYGFTSNLKKLVEVAHEYDVPVLVDEAHGAHLAFHPELPISAMEAGADLSAASTHKLVGSMTQSSVLLLKEGLIDPKRVKSVLNLSQTTSPSYILLSSIDVARKQMALEGKERLDNVLNLVAMAREELRKIDGLRVIGDEYVGRKGCYSWDPTKLIVNFRGLGLSGFEVETILRRKYKIQVELADLFNVLFLFSIGDNWQTVQPLINALRDIATERVVKNVTKIKTHIPQTPDLVVSPQEAFYSSTRVMEFEDAEDEISAEMIMAYPPGIPIICPGELITREIIEYVRVLKNEGCYLQGPEDPMIDNIKVISRHFVVIENQGMEEVG